MVEPRNPPPNKDTAAEHGRQSSKDAVPVELSPSFVALRKLASLMARQAARDHAAARNTPHLMVRPLSGMGTRIRPIAMGTAT